MGSPGSRADPREDRVSGMGTEDDIIRRAALTAQAVLSAGPEAQAEPEAAAASQPLLHFDEVEEALASGYTVFLCGSPEAVDVWRAMNFVCTTFAFPLDQVGEHRTELFNIFTDADVVILQADHKYWNAVSKSLALDLYGTAKRVRVVNLLAHGKPQSAEEMIAVVEATPDVIGVRSVEPPSPLDQHEDSGYLQTQTKSNFGAVFFSQVREISTSYGWAIKKVFALGEITLSFGDSGSGKSFDLIDAGMSVARGVDFKGHKVKKGLVIIFAGEAQKGLSRRILAYRKYHKIPLDEALPFVYCTRRPNLFADPESVQRVIDEIKWIAAQFEEPLVMVGFDTLSSVTAGMNEISGQDVAIVRNRFDQIAQATGAAIVITHHKPKNGGSPRGHGSLTADFEATIEYSREERSYGHEGPPVHTVIVRKQREEAAGTRWSFTLPVVRVGVDEDGDWITSCVSVEYERPDLTRATGPVLRSDQQRGIFKSILALLSDRGRDVPSKARAGGAKGILSQELLEYVQQKATIQEADPDRVQDRVRKGVERALSRFAELGIIDVWNAPSSAGKRETWLWLTGKWPSGFGPPRAPKKQIEHEQVSGQHVQESPFDLSDAEALTPPDPL